MQIQTTITTKETQNIEGSFFEIKTIEQTTSVFCECCSNQATGTKEGLRHQGWSFGNGCEFCPTCNYESFGEF